MPSFLPIGLGAGLAAAVLFASAVLGQSVLGLLLLLIVPLPKFLAGLGWGWPAALTAAVSATVLVAIVANPLAGVAYGVSQGAPAVWLCYIAYLNRTVGGPDQPQHVEWYPIGRVLAWAVAIAGVLAAMTLLTLGTSAEALRQQARKLVELFGKSLAQVDPKAAATLDADAMAALMLNLLPTAFAASALAGLLFNFWLAGRITRASGRLLRPWPDLAATKLPHGTALALAVATAASLPTAWTGVPEYARFIVAGFASALFMAYTLIGLAIIHYGSRGRAWRPFVLFAVYAALLLLNPWSALVIALVGLSETLVPWRRAPPPPPTGSPGGGPST